MNILKLIILASACVFSLNAVAQNVLPAAGKPSTEEGAKERFIEKLNRRCFEHYETKIKQIFEIKGFSTNEHLLQAIEDYKQKRIQCLQDVMNRKSHPPVVEFNDVPMHPSTSSKP